MGIIDAKLLFYNVFSEQRKYKKISMREYNDRTVYNCLNNQFSVDYGNPALNIPPIPIDDITQPNKISQYNFDPLPAAIYFTSGKYFSGLTTPSDSPQFFEINSDDHDANHNIMKDNPIHGRKKRGYCSRFHGGKDSTKIEVLLLHVFN